MMFIAWVLIPYVAFIVAIIIASVFYLAPQLGWLILSVLSYLAFYGFVLALIVHLPRILWLLWRRRKRSHG
jgi:hypothetical protein